jgi:hypothetical protein
MNDYLKEQDLWWPVSQELMASYKDGSHTKKWATGSLVWYKTSFLHRDGDNPLPLRADSFLHRDGDKPATIWPDGSLEWRKNGLLHRDGDKPAVIHSNGRLEWWKNGERHRETGPAVIHPNNIQEYWINGNNITKEVESWLETRKYNYPFTPEQQVEFVLTFG